MTDKELAVKQYEEEIKIRRDQIDVLEREIENYYCLIDELEYGENKEAENLGTDD